MVALLFFGTVAAQAITRSFSDQLPLTQEQLGLIKKSIAREKITIQEIRKHTPLVQTYIQEMRPDPTLHVVPASDQYMLSRVDFGKIFIANAYAAKSGGGGFFRSSANAIAALGRLLRINYSRDGFMDMMFIDPSGYDLEHYNFSFVRRQFLGDVRTAVFDVEPKPGSGSGRFIGRIWIEDQEGNIVRFNGSYTQGSSGGYWVHFDSWRSNMEPGFWLPRAIYCEEDQEPRSSKPALRAQTHFWGYSLKLPTHVSDNESVCVDNVIDESQQAQDVSPLQAQREWEEQAAQNVLDRLVEAGLVAPPSSFDKVLDQITDNLIIGNKLVLSGDVHCRVLLTTPLESASFGNTILISKGLIDVLPSEADLAAVLSFQLAQIALGHQIDTRYAFEDRLLFPDEATFQQIGLNHSYRDDVAAAKKAIELLQHSVYRDKLNHVALFLAELQSQQKTLKALMTPRLGDSLMDPQGAAWLSGVSQSVPRIEPGNLTQIAALPLGSHLKIDPWDDQVSYMHTAPAPILTARDKMPLEIAPIYFQLRRYSPPDTAEVKPGSSANPAASAIPPTADSAPAHPQP